MKINYWRVTLLVPQRADDEERPDLWNWSDLTDTPAATEVEEIEFVRSEEVAE